MKKVKFNKQLLARAISGGMSLVLVTSGCGLGKSNSKKIVYYELGNTTNVSNDKLNNQYLNDYIVTHDTLLERENTSLLEPEETLQNIETFNIENLIVMENTNENNQSDIYILHETKDSGTIYEYYMENKNENNQSDLHILNVPDEGGTCYEYCNELKTWFGLYPDINEQIYDLWPGFIHCNNCHPLFNYLTDKEIETVSNNGGKITRLDLERISARIRTEYKQHLLENNHSKSLTSN